MKRVRKNERNNVSKAMKRVGLFLGLLVAISLTTGQPARAESDLYLELNGLCVDLSDVNGGCYADNYAPANFAIVDFEYFSDCTFSTIVGESYYTYHTRATYPDYTTGWHHTTSGVTANFRTVETDNDYVYQQYVNSSWQTISGPCS
jgi:hypothetical protein